MESRLQTGRGFKFSASWSVLDSCSALCLIWTLLAQTYAYMCVSVRMRMRNLAACMIGTAADTKTVRTEAE